MFTLKCYIHVLDIFPSVSFPKVCKYFLFFLFSMEPERGISINREKIVR